MPLDRFHQAFRLLLCITLPLGAGGCIIAGFAASVYGDLPVAAVYSPANVPMLVLVKDTPDPTGMKIEADTVAREIEKQIDRHRIAPLVPEQKVDQFRRTNLSGFSTLPPAEIGRAVGAEQVLYVRIVDSSIDSGTAQDMLKGQMVTVISIIDPKTGKTLWPTDGSDGSTVRTATPMVRVAGQNSPATVSRALYTGVADQIVKLFRKHKPDWE